MKEYLDKLEISPILIILIYFLGIISKELWTLLKSNRNSISQTISKDLILEIENQLKLFYLPVCERFKMTKDLFDKTHQIGMPYKNESLNIKSKDPLALRNIIVNKLFLPFNKEIENVILNNLQLKHPEDDTNYDKIILHYRIWNSLEESKGEKLIDDYEASELLEFPAKEVENCKKMCAILISKRNELREKILAYRSINRSLLLTKKSKHGKSN
jgi:hypothetical protein